MSERNEQQHGDGCRHADENHGNAERRNGTGDAEALSQQAAELAAAGDPPGCAASHTHRIILRRVRQQYGNNSAGTQDHQRQRQQGIRERANAHFSERQAR
jgi:hypothetical protein